MSDLYNLKSKVFVILKLHTALSHYNRIMMLKDLIPLLIIIKASVNKISIKNKVNLTP